MNIDKELLEYKKKALILAVIENIINIICFTILAIVFKNFWLVFGSIFFMNFYGGNKKE